MTSGDAQARRRLLPRLLSSALRGLMVVVLLASCSTGAAKTGSNKSEVAAADASSLSPSAVRRDMVVDLLRSQQTAVRDGSLRRYLDTFITRTRPRAQARATYANLRRLAVADFAERLVSPLRASGARMAVHPRQVRVRVNVGWSVSGLVGPPVQSLVTLTVSGRGDEARVVRLRNAPAQPEPIWMMARESVRRSSCCLVTAPEGRLASSTLHLLQQVSVDVDAALGPQRSRLVALVRPSSLAVARTVGASAHAYAGIASVTSPMGRTAEPGAPVAIVVDAEPFTALSMRGRRALLTHEATHVATGATGSSLPRWLVEGFADFVALRAVELPVGNGAQALVGDLRRHGVPAALPRNPDFAGRGRRLEPVYEESWLAVRLLARLSSPQDVTAFYAECSAHPGHVRSILEGRYGLSWPRFTATWRGVLERLVSG